MCRGEGGWGGSWQKGVASWTVAGIHRSCGITANAFFILPSTSAGGTFLTF